MTAPKESRRRRLSQKAQSAKWACRDGLTRAHSKATKQRFILGLRFHDVPALVIQDGSRMALIKVTPICGPTFPRTIAALRRPRSELVQDRTGEPSVQETGIKGVSTACTINDFTFLCFAEKTPTPEIGFCTCFAQRRYYRTSCFDDLIQASVTTPSCWYVFCSVSFMKTTSINSAVCMFIDSLFPMTRRHLFVANAVIDRVSLRRRPAEM